jgi:PPIC-type PPIASE domain
MRLRLALASLVAVAACGNFRDTFTSRSGVAAEAGSLELSTDRLAKILQGPRGLRATKDAASFVTNLWVDYALFAQAAAQGKLPTDSASAAKALWPELAEIKSNHWHDSLMARRPQPGQAAVDSLYNGDQVRVLQHILFQAQPNAKPDQKVAARKKAEQTLAQIKGGADFGKLASQLSDDPGSKRDAGYLPPSPKGAFVGPFDSAGWKLAPGAVSGVVQTPFGYHIIKRPSETEAQPRLVAFLGRSAGQHADSLYMDSLAKANNLTVEKTAPVEMKSALNNPDASRGSKKTLVGLKNGSFTVADYLKWVNALPPQYMAQLKTANDTMLTGFARVLALNTLLLRQADSAKVQPTPDEWQQLYSRYTAAIDSLQSDMGLAGDSAGAKGAAKDAGAKVDQYFDRLVSGQVRLRQMPSQLGSVLRERSRYRIYDAGVTRAFQKAQAEQAKADSATAKTAPQGPMQPAPGPAPVPGAPAPAPKADSAKK